jgi:hypothetical protein
LIRKIAILVCFVFLAVLAAGLFGMIHDQISYTVSDEYFTKFKFVQFRLLDSAFPGRIRASIVGFRASWWMGIPLGLLCGAAGLIQRSPRLMWEALLWSLLVIVTFTLAVALAGLGFGWMRTQTIDVVNYRGWFIPADVNDLRRFLCAGYMHNAAYLGGALSISVAWLFNFIFGRATRDQLLPR